jgi:pimeloyl-ACP methyl ester carboxylesterase
MPDIAGTWLGTLELVSVRVVVNIERDAGGNLGGTLDSPDQGGFGIPLSRVEVSGNLVTLAADSLALVFTGELSEDARQLSGTLLQAGESFPLSLERQPGRLDYRRPQDPLPPLPYESADVSFASDAPDVTLAGTLVWPSGAGPFPAVVLISGSGPQNRDEELLNHRPFLVLADALVRAGVAVLRYDDRGFGESTGDFAAATSADFALDAQGAVRFLSSQAEFPVATLGLAGHSEGGLLAPLVAREKSEVDFLVLLAAPGVDGKTILISQSRAVAAAQGVPGPELDAVEAQQQAAYACFGAPDAPIAALDACLRAALVGVTGADLEATLTTLETPWMRYFVTYDPAPVLRQTQIPVLALNGSLDLQVLAPLNLGAIDSALREAENPAVSIRELAGLNHLFQHAVTGLPSEYGSIEETFAPEALTLITDWIASLAPGASSIAP